MVHPGTPVAAAPRTSARQLFSMLLSMVLAVGAIFFGPGAVTPASALAGDFTCGNNTLYGTFYAAAGQTTTLYRVDASTGTSTSVGTFAANVSVNALAISKDGDAAYAISTPASATGAASLYKYGTAAAYKTLSGLTANAGIPAGGFNPVTNDYWFATVDNASTGTFRFYRVDLDSAATAINFTTPTMTFTDVGIIGASVGTDLTFDGQGRMYLVVSTNTAAYTNQLVTFSPAQLTAGGAQTGSKLVDLDAGSATTTFPGVAFGSSGHLYTEGGTTLYQSNPTNGAQVSTRTTPVAFSDLGSCANPTIINALRKNVVNRKNAGDQFTLSLSGTGFDTPSTATAATPATGIQNEQVGAAVVLPNTTYTISETAANGANLNNYLSTWECVNVETDAVIQSGTGATGAFTTPDTVATGKGVPITCTFTNAVLDPRIQISKNASGTPTKAGDSITYSFTVTNTGNRPLTGIAVTDAMLGTVTCVDTSLAVGASTTCSAPAHLVTQPEVEAGSVVNTASVAANPPAGEGPAGSVTDTDIKTVTITRTPQLKIVKTASGSPFVAGDQITYSFTLSNTGNITLTGVGVNDPLLASVTCLATTLAPGASTTCSAPSYSVTPADVTAGKVVNTATPTGASGAGAPTVDPSSTPSVTVTLGTMPAAAPDTGTTPQNVNVDVDPLANDTAGKTGSGASGSLVAGSVVLTSAAATDGGRTLVVAGQGTWTVNATTGLVTFDPEPGFTGGATAVAYRVTDSLGHTADSTITITVAPVLPDAVNDSASTPYLAPVTVPVLGNDAAGAASAPLVPASLIFTSAAATDGGKTLVVPGEGTYTIDPLTGAVTFTPVAGFAGAATPVTYRVTDANGTTDTASLTITVTAPPAPNAAPDTAATLQNVDVQLNPVTNDTANGGAVLDPASVVFTSAAATNAGRTLVVPGEGTYTIDPATGMVTLDPSAAFNGTTTPVGYRISDNLGRTANSTITITVTGVQPSASADSALTPYRTPVNLTPLANDTAGDASAPLVPGSFVYTSAAAIDGGKTLVVPGEGTWTVLADGTAGFAPANGFSGPSTPVGYRVYDANGSSAASTLTVTVGTPPVATPDAGTTPQNVNITLDPLSNDAAGSTGPSVGTLVGSSVVFTSGSATDSGRTLVVAGEGTYSIDPLTGAVSFDPEPAFSGPATPVGYLVVDSFGNDTNSTITITVTAIAPNAANDADHTPFDTPVTTTLLGNDVAGAASAPLVPGSVVFTSAAATNAGKTLVVPGEGTYQVNPDGSVTFTPDAGFTGVATPVAYRVGDTNGTTATATATITVGAPPAANPDLGSTPQDVTVTVPLLDNDLAGNDGAGTPGTIDPASVLFTSPAATNGGRTLVVAGEGTYTIDPATGAVTFDPEPAFTGPAAPVSYQVTDSFGHAAASTLAVTVTAIIPTATDDATHTPSGTPVTAPVLGNDSSGAPSAPLVPGSVVISTAGATDAGRTLVVPGHGTWTVQPDGSIRFAPEAGFAGPATIAYQVSDTNGTPATANLTVTVGTPPAASDDLGSTPQNVNVTVAPLADDTAGDDGDGSTGTLDPASLVFTSPAATNAGRTLVVPGEGSYTIDPATGEVVFDPETAFTGPATPVDYRVTDSFGNTAAAQIAITVTPVIPTAANDSATTGYRTPVTVDLLANDAPGAATAPLAPASVVFTSAAATDAGKTLVVPGEGTFTLAADGRVTFTPVPGFTGIASAVGYAVTDANGTVATATVTLTVTPPPAPSVVDDANHTPYRTTITTAVLGNDTAGGLATLQPASVRLTDPAAVNGGRTLFVAGQGTFQVNPDGTIAFTPVAGFTGDTDSVGYEVGDELGQTGSAHLVITVGVPPAASDDSATTPQNVPVTLNPLANDTAGDNGAGVPGSLVPSSVLFTSASATDAGHTLVVAGQGTWTIAPISGAITFAPEPGFTGPTTPVAYEVRDGFGNTATANDTVTVTPVTPVAGDDSATTPFRTPVTSTVLGNDSAGAATAPLDSSSVVFASPSATLAGTRLVVGGEGLFEVNPDGTVTFTPEAGFSGATSPVTYRVTDTNGTTASAALVVTVGAPPVAVDDTATTPHDTPVTLHPLGNDTPGDDGAGLPGTLDATSVVFTSAAATDGDHTLVVAGQGTWTIDPATGATTFDPEPGFTGTTSSVAYRVTDSFGHTATATLAVTVGARPAASDDSASTPQNVDVTVDPLGNDTAGDDGTGTPGTLVPASVVFTAAAATDAGKTLAVAGEGTYTIDPATGQVTFDPDDAFTGIATAVDYAVSDSFGNTAAAKLRITVVGIEPIAADDTAVTPAATPVTVPVLGNDTPGAGSAPLVPSSVVITTPGATNAGKTLVVAGEGTWQVFPDGTITFTPEADFAGGATPVDYRLADTNGTTATASVDVTVGEPPAASDDPATTPQGVPVTLDPLGNDDAGDDGSGVPGTLDPASVVFTSAAATDAGRTLVVAGQGTWTIDPATGRATFTPEPAFTGVATPAAYAVTDSFGNTVTAELQVTVTPIVPTAIADTGHTPYQTAVTVPVLANDTAGAASAPLDPASVVFTSADATDAGKTLVVPGEGTWTVTPAGAVTFAPEAGFTGPTSAADYRVADGNGTIDHALVTVTVGEPPVATDDITATPQNVTVTLDPLADDAAGDDGAGTPGTLDPASVVFTSPAATGAGKTLVVAGEGIWTVDAGGQVTFDPEAAFIGAATPVHYSVTDSFGHTAEADLRVTVATIVPTAADDSAGTPFRTPVTVPVLVNDSEGAASAPLDVASVVFTSPAATDAGKTLVVAGEGTWTANADGSLTFTPENGFAGSATPVQYRVSDSNGTPVAAVVRVTVGAPPAASDDSATTPQNVTVTLCPPCNDTAGDDGAGTPGTLDATSVVLTSPDATDAGRTLVVPGEGTWTIDPVTGQATFDPETAFTGTTTPVAYRITDGYGHNAAATLRLVVVPVEPAAAQDSGNATFNTPVTIDILGNDLPGDASAPLVPGSVVFTSPDATDSGKTLVVPGEGTWTVNPDGTVTFTPLPGFSGTATPVAYAVTDTNGVVADSTVRAVIGVGPAASADQAQGTEPGEAIVLSVLGNDAGGAGCTLQAASLVLVDGATATELTVITVPGEGSWTANTDGTLTFTPEDGFKGWTSWVTYRITDSCGNPVTSTARAYEPAPVVDADGDDGSLAYTGSEVGGLIGLAAALLVGGLGLLAWRRRRQA